MNLEKLLSEQIADPSLTPSERAQLRVQLSRALEESGDYEGAREALGELWSRVGERPVLEGLDQRVAAEVLRQAGVLTSSIGSARQVEGAQETAKDLISTAVSLFEALGDSERVAEAQTDLAVCYWRQGEFDEARLWLQEALNRLPDSDSEVKAVALIRAALVERGANRLNDALRIYNDAAPFFEQINNHALKGKFHVGFALALKNLGAAEDREDYIDRALVEFTAASFHFEQAGHERYCARVENNLAMLFLKVGRFNLAHEHAARARQIFAGLRDNGSVAQVDETRARVLLAEGRNEEAERVARSAVQTLEQGDEQALLAEALMTHGTALARTGQHGQALLSLRCAVAVAERVGDLEDAGQAALTIIEEACAHLGSDELCETYLKAADLLHRTQHPGILARLNECARRVVATLAERFASSAGPNRANDFGLPFNWEGFSLRDEVRRFEGALIERALGDADGSVTQAARLLGLRYHHTLVAMLKARHKELLRARTPAVPRRRSIIRLRSPRHTPFQRAEKEKRPAMILHVEDNPLVADAVRETLELEGWEVEDCAEGSSALAKIVGDTHYDLLLLDYDLPGVNGVELARRARALEHRRRTPIIVLSGSDCEAEARGAGANAFLKKPEGIPLMVETIAQLIGARDGED